MPDYDLKLARTLQGANLESPPPLWDQFDALARIPLMVIRGTNSDVLASTTLDAITQWPVMRQCQPDLAERSVRSTALP